MYQYSIVPLLILDGLHVSSIYSILQQLHKRRFKVKTRLFRLLLLPLFILKHTPTAYSLPGTKFAIVQGEWSRDLSCQR